jgi:hypothetical protein
MLEKLLGLVAEGGIHSLDELAGRLSVTPPLLEAMLEDLVRLGYLREAGEGCGAQCSGCSMGGCSGAGAEGGRLWAITGKGMRAAAR